nr:MAG TPA: hypothetical protein [Caudoviricetes sp.]
MLNHWQGLPPMRRSISVLRIFVQSGSEFGSPRR